MRDAVLNAVSHWPAATWTRLTRRRSATVTAASVAGARQYACRLRWQQSELRVLASFRVTDEATGEESYLTGDRDAFIDVTAITREITVIQRSSGKFEFTGERVTTTDRSVAVVRRLGQRLYVTAVSAGTTQ